MYNNDTNYIDGQIRKLLKQFYQFEQVELLSLHSGMNNITRVVKHQGQSYNLRIFCNHQELEKVHYEHTILRELHKKQLKLSVPIPVVIDGKGSVAMLDDGRLVAMYHYIDGTQERSRALLLKLAQATGILSKALSSLKLESTGEYSPYYELEANYPAFTKEQLKASLGDKPHEQLYTQLCYLLDIREQLEQKKEQFASLPHQLIHGDINFSNAVVQDDEVIGILDFEFVTYDVRAMELAILFTEYFKLNTQFDKQSYDAMLISFTKEHELTEAELNSIPDLIKLRAVDVAMHFLTRFRNGQDELKVLEYICHECYRVVNEVEMHLQYC